MKRYYQYLAIFSLAWLSACGDEVTPSSPSVRVIGDLELPGAIPDSTLIYRIPFGDNMRLKVFSDANTHNPKGRIDIYATASASARVVAAAAGTVRYIQDRFSKVDRNPSDGCDNNYVWIEHSNGEWTKYSHMAQNTTTGNAGLRVGSRVKQGTFLGYESDVGCTNGKHLHFEVGVPRRIDPITLQGGYLNDNAGQKRNRNPRICNIPNQRFAHGQTYRAKPCPRRLRP
jgi:murein DD-endopeptidase MepM/ murein hydrolase activator NlpD